MCIRDRHEHQQPVGALPVSQSVRARLDSGSDRVDEPVQRRGAQRCVRTPGSARSAPAELVIDDPPGGVQPFAEPRDVGGVRPFHERRPTPGPGEGRLHLRCQLVDHVPVLGLGGELSHQRLQRMPQMPLTQVQLGLREASAHRVGETVIVVTHDPGRGAIEGGEERCPVGLRRGRQGSKTTGANTSTQSITSDPCRVNRGSPLSGSARSRRARPGHQRRVAVRGTGADHAQRPSDPARDELVAPRRVRTFVEADVALASLAGLGPGLLPRKVLREAMRTLSVDRNALVQLSTMPGHAIMAVDAGPGFASTAIMAWPGIVDSCTSAFRSTESVRIASRRTFRGRSPGPRPARLASATSASTKVRTRRGATSSSRAGSLGRWAWSAPVPRTATRRWWPGRARRLRADPDSGEPRFTRHGSLVMDWVEVFAPVVFEPCRPRRWPTGGSLLLDDLPFRVRDPRTGRHRVAFRIFAAMGYEAGRPKLWRLEAFPSKSEADWTAFLAALAPTRVVSDNDHGLTNAVRARFPQAELYLCEWHLRHALERLMGKLAAEAKYRDVIDELAPQVEAAFAGARSWCVQRAS